VLLAEGELVGKDVGDRGDAGGRVLREGSGDGGAAVAAAEQAEAHDGVGLIAEGGFGLDDEETGGCGSGLEEVSSVHGFSSCLSVMQVLRCAEHDNVAYVICAITFSR
jgi:hypothetical protein